MLNLTKSLKVFLAEEEGASVVEYAVLVVLIIAVCVVVIGVVGSKTHNSFEDFNTSFNTN
jgi:Flp pilus assembly pilin Flp